jgi:protein ImuB
LPARVRRWSHEVWIEAPRKNLMSAGPAPARSAAACLKSEIRGSTELAEVNPQSEIPLVLVRPVAQRQIIVAVNYAARSSGIRPGMTLSEARAIDATVRHAPHEPQKDAVALEALARWMMRFSPVVAAAADTDQSEIRNPQSAIFLDLTGCQRYFGGTDVIVRLVRQSLTNLRLTAHLAVASNPGAAWALTFSPRHQDAIVAESQLPAALRDLPPAVLRLDPDLVGSLHHLGLDTIDALLKLPRDALPARFGAQLLLRLDQALGKVNEPLVPLEPFSPIAARMDFDGPVEALEAVWMVFKRLIGQVVAELLKRGRGARVVEVEYFRPYAVTLHQSIRLSRPSRDPVNLFNLLRCASETLDTDVGFLGIRLVVTSSERVAEDQITLLEHEQFVGEIELSHLIERLCVRMGERAVASPRLVESHVPEKAFCERVQSSEFRVHSEANGESASTGGRALRPLHLLKTPDLIRVIVTPSDDSEGLPASFTARDGAVRRLSHVVGPERIGGRWWAGHNKTRDYFDVEDATSGERFWIFRVIETREWYLHGVFE